MNVNIDQPELQQFVEEQVRSGRYGSAADVVASALARYRDGDEPGDDDEIDDATAARLSRAYDRGARGDGGSTIEVARERLQGWRADGPGSAT